MCLSTRDAIEKKFILALLNGKSYFDIMMFRYFGESNRNEDYQRIALERRNGQDYQLSFC